MCGDIFAYLSCFPAWSAQVDRAVWAAGAPMCSQRGVFQIRGSDYEGLGDVLGGKGWAGQPLLYFFQGPTRWAELGLIEGDLPFRTYPIRGSPGDLRISEQKGGDNKKKPTGTAASNFFVRPHAKPCRQFPCLGSAFHNLDRALEAACRPGANTIKITLTIGLVLELCATCPLTPFSSPQVTPAWICKDGWT